MDASPFARLPAELRTAIWTYALQDSWPIEFLGNISPYAHLPRQRMLALTEACKVIRAETSLLFFQVNTFAFYNILYNLDGDFNNYTSLIGLDAIKSLRNLIFDVHILGRKNTSILAHACSPELLEALSRFRRFALVHPRCDCTLHFGPVPVLETAVIDLHQASTSLTAVIAKLRTSEADRPSQARAIEFAARVMERWRDVLGQR